MLVKITHNKSNIIIPLEKFALMKDNIDLILLVAQFMQGIVGLNSLTPDDFNQPEERKLMTSSMDSDVTKH